MRKGLLQRGLIGAARAPIKVPGIGARAGQEFVDAATPILGMGANAIMNDPSVSAGLSAGGSALGTALGTGASSLIDSLAGALAGASGGSAAPLSAFMASASKAAPALGGAIGGAAAPVAARLLPALTGVGASQTLGKFADLAGVEGMNPFSKASGISSAMGAALPMMMQGMGKEPGKPFGTYGQGNDFDSDYDGSPVGEVTEEIHSPKRFVGGFEEKNKDTAAAMEGIIGGLAKDMPPTTIGDALKPSPKPFKVAEKEINPRGDISKSLTPSMSGTDSFFINKGVPVPRFSVDNFAGLKEALSEPGSIAMGEKEKPMVGPSQTFERAKTKRYPQR